MTTATKHLNNAHTAVLAIAERASAVLASYEGTGATMSYAEIASLVGIDLRGLGQTDTYLVYLGLEAAIEHRGWQDVQNEGEPRRVRKPVTVTEYKTMNERQRTRRARA